ncbi:hypothetical protein AVEN_236376-1, partial [Araneus ventricosus]
FECCGVQDGGDYADSSWKKNNEEKNVSPTCCVLRNAGQSDSYLVPQPLNESMCQKEDGMNMRFRHQSVSTTGRKKAALIFSVQSTPVRTNLQRIDPEVPYSRGFTISNFSNIDYPKFLNTFRHKASIFF